MPKAEHIFGLQLTCNWLLHEYVIELDTPPLPYDKRSDSIENFPQEMQADRIWTTTVN